LKKPVARLERERYQAMREEIFRSEIFLAKSVWKRVSNAPRGSFLHQRIALELLRMRHLMDTLEICGLPRTELHNATVRNDRDLGTAAEQEALRRGARETKERNSSRRFFSLARCIRR